MEVLIEAGLWFGQSIGQGDFLFENADQLPLGNRLLVFLAVRNKKVTGPKLRNRTMPARMRTRRQ